MLFSLLLPSPGAVPGRSLVLSSFPSRSREFPSSRLALKRLPAPLNTWPSLVAALSPIACGPVTVFPSSRQRLLPLSGPQLRACIFLFGVSPGAAAGAVWCKLTTHKYQKRSWNAKLRRDPGKGFSFLFLFMQSHGFPQLCKLLDLKWCLYFEHIVPSHHKVNVSSLAFDLKWTLTFEWCMVGCESKIGL